MLRVRRNAGHRADLHALGGIEMAHAFGAFVRVDPVDFRPEGDRLVRAFWLTHVAVDALVGDHQRHGVSPGMEPQARGGRWAFMAGIILRCVVRRSTMPLCLAQSLPLTLHRPFSLPTPMGLFFLKRSMTLLATLVGASIVVFLVLEILPGNTAQILMGPDAAPDAVAAL